MKKLLSVFCVLLLVVTIVPINAFAAGKSGSLGAKATGFKFKDVSCKIEYKEPNFKELDCDEERTVFFSSKGSVELKSEENFEKNAYISVRIKKPELKRSLNLLHPTTFLRKVPKDVDTNRFYIQGPRLKAPFWHPIKKIGYWWNPQYITINYGLVVTDKDDEKVYALPRVELGDKTKEKEEADKLREATIQRNEGYVDKSYEGLMIYGKYAIREKGKLIQPYHTDETAKKQNAENEKKKEEFRKKLANTNKVEMFEEGEIARLTPNSRTCTFRLVINNNESLDADRMAMLLAHQDNFEQINDSSKLELEYVYVYPLPDRLKSAEKDASSLSGRLNSNQRPRVNLVREMQEAMDVRRIPTVKSMLKSVKKTFFGNSKEPMTIESYCDSIEGASQDDSSNLEKSNSQSVIPRSTVRRESQEDTDRRVQENHAMVASGDNQDSKPRCNLLSKITSCLKSGSNKSEAEVVIDDLIDDMDSDF